jgi:hypothetical protein
MSRVRLYMQYFSALVQRHASVGYVYRSIAQDMTDRVVSPRSRSVPQGLLTQLIFLILAPTLLRWASLLFLGRLTT